jgi:hypothetical protein
MISGLMIAAAIIPVANDNLSVLRHLHPFDNYKRLKFGAAFPPGACLR